MPFALALISAAIGTLLSLLNLFLGWSLSQNSEISADHHLALALASIAFLIVGHLGLLLQSEKEMRSWVENNSSDEVLEILAQKKTRASGFSWSLLGASLLSLISGTIAQSGQIPWLHSLLGLSLVGLSLFACGFWISYRRDPLASLGAPKKL